MMLPEIILSQAVIRIVNNIYLLCAELFQRKGNMFYEFYIIP